MAAPRVAFEVVLTAGAFYTGRMPEKSLAQVPRHLREQYEKGKAAFERNNLDYAITILTAVLEQEPAFYECREALRATQFKRAQGRGGTGFLKKFLSKSALPKAMAVLRRDPLEAIRLCEQTLNGDPNSLAAHKVLAEAALAADLPRTAVLSLEIAHRQAPDDRDVTLKLAKALASLGQWDRAEKLVNELVQAHPDDPDLLEEAKNISAQRTLKEAGYEKLADGQGSYRDVLKDKEEAVALEQEDRIQRGDEARQRLLERYLKELEAEPHNQRLLRQIAEIYVERKEFDRALEYYERLRGTEAVDPSLERAIADLCAKRYDHALEQLDPDAPDYEEKAAAIRREKQEFLIADAARRVERFPTDLQLRYELGVLLFEAGRIQEAIAQFQKSQSHPHRRISSLFYLGRCFLQRGMADLAVRTFQNALKEKQVMDEEKKDLIYHLGLALEQLNRPEEAIEQFKTIFEVDIGFRDVAQRVDAYYARRSGENPPAG
ncbi:MAG: tetratricopeptide repeat protein [Verrucomicrobia bacterium]|nr:MAG: tetratricopeptide repeat protein [Verrucomicrobiota bacterium]